MQLKISPSRLILISVSMLIASSLLLALVLPDSIDTAAVSQGTESAGPLPTRPDLAPPATQTGLMIATPEFATSVPMALTHNFDPDQFALGRRTYTQWCATCHGDRGQGLDLWRSSWDEAHQNCTKSGCHGSRHGGGGFTMLKVAPPLIGPSTLMTFENAFQLYYFVRATMPFQAPGSLSDEEYWAVVTFLSDQHGADAAGKRLNDATAQVVKLH